MNEAENGSMIVLDGSKSSLVEDAKSKQDDLTLVELKALMKERKVEVFSQEGRLCP